MWIEVGAFGLAFAIGYAALAWAFFRHAPLMFDQLDRAFDADLGSWTIDLTRWHGPHTRTQVHPISILLLNPFGTAIREVLRAAGVDQAGRLAAGFLCALAGGATVSVFRLLVGRLGLSDGRGRMWTLVFALSATQVVFSAIPESYAFSALGLTLVFAAAARREPSRTLRIGAGVVAFGVTVTNLVAVAATELCLSGGRYLGSRRRAAALHVAAVVAITAALSLTQAALVPSAPVFFVPQRLPYAYAALAAPKDVSAGLRRLAAVVSHVGFAGVAAPRATLRPSALSGVDVDVAELAWLTPSPWSAAHWLIWATALVVAARGFLDVGPRPVEKALLLWLAFVGGMHLFFGTSLFLYSGHWVFAVVALTASGLERYPLRQARFARFGLVVLVLLQVAANALLVRQILISL